jgi:hypothetical protein
MSWEQKGLRALFFRIGKNVIEWAAVIGVK